MRNTATTTVPTDPAPHGYFTTSEMRARWCCGRTKLYDQVGEPGFPQPFRIGRTMLYPRHLIWEWEAAQQDGTVAEQLVIDMPVGVDFPALPAAKRPGPQRDGV